MKRRAFIQTLMIGSGALVVGGKRTFASGSEGMIKVSIMYNNIGKSEALIGDWGLSILVEHEEEALLFDTGGDGKILLQNLQSMKVDLDRISTVVISHNHGDHLNGLRGILENINQQPKIYVPDHELQDIQASFPGSTLIGVGEPAQLNSFAWTTGQLVGNQSIYEQSIILKQGDFIYVFTGCSHPGVVNIVEKVKRIFFDEDIRLVAGGFHLMNHTDKQILDISDKLKNLSVEKIAPSHCTGNAAMNIFQDEWENDFINFDLSSRPMLI
jgi:7,8-dihydropterin-6-yl-methyl-4-(beta-D-ribofuranosyl)aminobenzene 5'-phosphate synthase